MDIEHLFSYHPPKDDETRIKHEAMRENFKAIAHYVQATLSDGREKSLVITHLQSAMMFANASIALNQ